MDKPIRVAQVIGKAIDGGTEAFAMNYYKHLDHNLVEFDFLIENDSNIINPEMVSKFGNGNIVYIPSYTNPVHYTKKLIKIFKANEYDVVHSNMNALSLFALYSAKKANISVRIAHSHSTSSKKEIIRSIIKKLLRPFSKCNSTHLFACSQVAGEWLFGKRAYQKHQIQIIRNAIDVRSFSFNPNLREKIRKKYNIPKDAVVLGHVGRFQKQKNHKFLVDVFFQFHKYHENSFLLLVGEGPLQESVISQIKSYNIEGNVIFAGVHNDISSYYCAMDCFLFPSLYEGLGITLVEAQASGLMCIKSENVPDEAVVLEDYVLTCGLKQGAIEWAKKTEKILLEQKNREVNVGVFSDKGYDIFCASKKLIDIYIALKGNKYESNIEKRN